MIHHDIKPDNLLINNDNCLKIIDFGISQENNLFQTNSLSGTSYGTKLYFAPEKFFSLINVHQYEGDKADLYAAGVTLHQLACGERAHPSSLRFFPLISLINFFFHLILCLKG